MKDTIEEGDIVHVNCNAAQTTLSHEARVIHKPVASGDGWVFKDLISGDIIHVTEGITIIRHN